ARRCTAPRTSHCFPTRRSSDLLDSALTLRRAGPYQLQAAIAARHATAADAADTDWAEIARLYGELTRVLPSPVVELNRAVAVAIDRKSTRLNSSHVKISYAVFC